MLIIFNVLELTIELQHLCLIVDLVFLKFRDENQRKYLLLDYSLLVVASKVLVENDKCLIVCCYLCGPRWNRIGAC
jgi:hypothetical protein